MPTLILVRHGRTAANADGVLAGRSPGVDLDETGKIQADAVARRLVDLPLARLVSSPLERTVQTASVIAQAHPQALRVRRDKSLIECGYGSWTGQPIKSLAKEPLWKTVQSQPSAVVFPDGESMIDMQRRAVGTVRRTDAEVAAEAGADACWVAVSHGDVIKSIVADALGMHLDLFQRIVVQPGSVCVISYGAQRPNVVHVNDLGSALESLKPPRRKRRRRRTGDAVIGGGDGPV
ncbi:MAG: MSMEG_4193 family putative phosphomutase [Nocardioidaceae bacterium]